MQLAPHIIAVQMDLVRRRSYGLLRSDGEEGVLGRELQTLVMSAAWWCPSSEVPAPFPHRTWTP